MKRITRSRLCHLIEERVSVMEHRTFKRCAVVHLLSEYLSLDLQADTSNLHIDTRGRLAIAE